MAAFPTTVATDSDLYIAVNTQSTQLTDNPLSNSATTVNVVSTTGFPTVGFISIDSEIIKYTGKNATQFTGCTRGADGTTAVSHVQNSFVFHNVIAAHHNVLKDDLIATQQFISDTIGRNSAKLQVGDGSVSNPSYTFAAQTGLGFYRAGSNRVALAFGGSIGLDINFASGVFDLTSNLFLAVGSGAVGTPSIANRSVTSTGWYFPTTLSQTFVVGGNPFVTVRADNSVDKGIYINNGYLKFGTGAGGGGDGTAGAPILSWESDTDTGIYRGGANTLAFSTGGTAKLVITTTVIEPEIPISAGTDGTVTAPFYTFSTDSDTGFYRFGSGAISVTTNGYESIRFQTSAGSDNTLYTPIRFAFGTTGASSVSGQKTTSVTTTPKLIGGVSFGLVLVYGNDGSNSFVDLVLSSYNSTVVVIAQKTHAGSPATRTYSNDGTGLLLAMGSGTYTTAVMQFDVGF